MLSKAEPIIALRICDELHRIYPIASVKAIAESVNIDRRIISRLGRGSVPSAPNLQAMAECGVDLNYCFTGKRGDTN